MIVELVEYHRSCRQQRTVFTEVPASCDWMYFTLHELGGNLSMEVLSTGEVSVTIEDREAQDDYDIEIVPPRMPIGPALTKMLERFDSAKFASWRAKTIEINQG